MSALCPQGRARDMELAPTRFKALPRYQYPSATPSIQGKASNSADSDIAVMHPIHRLVHHTPIDYDIRLKNKLVCDGQGGCFLVKHAISNNRTNSGVFLL